MVIAIDGTSASGKSTVARLLAKDLSFFNLNSGNLYRALSYAICRSGIDPGDEMGVVRFAEKSDLALVSQEEVMLDGNLMDFKMLHTSQIDSVSSKISFYVPVRQRVNRALRKFASGRDVICEGRDITSVVFADTPYKFYMDADLRERAKRRAAERGEDFGKVLKDLERRDAEDLSKPFGALRVMPDAVLVDSTDKTPEEVCLIIKRAVFSRKC